MRFLKSIALLMTCTAAISLAETDQISQLMRVTREQLLSPLAGRTGVDQLEETSEAGTVPASDWLWHHSDDGCLQSGFYETGKNRYVIDEPYPHDELMVFVEGGVTLTPEGGESVIVGPGDTVAIPAGWRGIWESDGYRKFYVIYDCP